MSKQYTNVGLPNELIEKIDKIIASSGLGYKSRGEVVKEAVRDFLMKIADYRILKKTQNKGKD